MDPRSAGELCQTADRVLHLIGSDHHKIRQLIDNDDKLRQFLRDLISRDIPALRQSLNLRVISLQITDI